MNQLNQSKPAKHSKLKVAMIPLLLLLLIYALIPSEETPPVAQNNSSSTKSKPLKNKTESVVGAAEKLSQTKHNWPEMSLAEITQHDPFRSLPLFHKKKQTKIAADGTQAENQDPSNSGSYKLTEEEKLAKIREKLQAQVISGILVGPNRKSAIINSKIYSEGDLLDEGVRIIQISPDGVVVQVESVGQLTLN